MYPFGLHAINRQEDNTSKNCTTEKKVESRRVYEVLEEIARLQAILDVPYHSFNQLDLLVVGLRGLD